MSYSGQVKIETGLIDRVRSGACTGTRANLCKWIGGVIILILVISGLVYYFSPSGETCDTVGISDAYCAVLFDQDDCDMSSNLLKVKDGEQGRLGTRFGTLFTKKLKRNDLESLIVKAHCRLELWDDDDGIDKGAKPDFVLDNTFFSTSKYIDSFEKISSIKHLDESVSAYRCYCKEPDLTMKFWEADKEKEKFSVHDIYHLFKIQDKNNDKFITNTELVLFGLTQQTADKLLGAADIDGDGKLSYIEWSIVMEALNSSM